MERRNIVSAVCVLVQSLIARAQNILSHNALGTAGTAGS
jgi:hypothetical protein